MKITKGDVFKIKAKNKLALIQFLEKDEHGELVKIFIIEDSDLIDTANIVNDDEDMFMYFMLSLSYKNNLVSYLGNYEIKVYSKPIFMRTIHKVRGEFLGWHILNLKTLKRELYGELDENQLKLSPYGIANPNLLKEWIEKDYNLKNWGNT